MNVLRYLVPIVGLGMAVAGADKLAGSPAYLPLYRRWGWSERAMRWTGAAELAGGTMMAFPGTRRMGGAILVGASVAQLTAELEHGEGELALPRAGVMAAGLLAFLFR